CSSVKPRNGHARSTAAILTGARPQRPDLLVPLVRLGGHPQAPERAVKWLGHHSAMDWLQMSD
ncbi:MAG: hypothetical protein QOE53_2084, partial [Pseudonocardiales bacterium]|nr:hypothetical protein [Pseudonocardiales bacterium]